MADHMIPGGLAAAMVRLFAASGSWEQVSRQLYAEYGVVISGQTLRRWARILDIDETPQACRAS
jgi:hypothetical protein